MRALAEEPNSGAEPDAVDTLPEYAREPAVVAALGVLWAGGVTLAMLTGRKMLYREWHSEGTGRGWGARAGARGTGPGRGIPGRVGRSGTGVDGGGAAQTDGRARHGGTIAAGTEGYRGVTTGGRQGPAWRKRGTAGHGRPVHGAVRRLRCRRIRSGPP